MRNKLALLFCEQNESNYRLIAGVDEAGRGPLAGNVVAAAVILDPKSEIIGLNDSKKLSESTRDKLSKQIKQQALAFAIAEADVSEIDRLNILQATMLAMQRAVAALQLEPDFTYVDGNRSPQWAYKSKALIKGDQRIQSIAAASILAKVHRDQCLRVLHEQFPGYGFAKHKGYPTAEHLAALQALGPCPVHRRSYAPVKAVLETK
ncbi:MAG: ribonuclease HII [SAR86 cluster bacterium]|uniref:Ribonuclease HII n=1 Tax=SAR86 cluster bacterium TaxID=2030880 RepID=A0A2A5CA77_9GAMM|nr:MAG: ribonuclease HII [SAR86 cluster bacterium]